MSQEPVGYGECGMIELAITAILMIIVFAVANLVLNRLERTS